MRIQNILLALLLAMLCGCQPKAPAPQAAAPAAVQPPAAPAPTIQPAASEAAAAPSQRPAPAAVEKAKPVIAERPAQTTPAPAVAEPAAKAESTVAEAKPAAKPEPVVSEAEAMQLAKRNNCLACHAVDRKVVGPAWRDVAAKYRGDAEAETRLTNKIAKGGSGVWGVMVMPPSPQVSEADRRTLARFVLSLK